MAVGWNHRRALAEGSVHQVTSQGITIVRMACGVTFTWRGTVDASVYEWADPTTDVARVTCIGCLANEHEEAR